MTLEGNLVLKSEQKNQGLNTVCIVAPASGFHFTATGRMGWGQLPKLQIKSLVFIQTELLEGNCL